MGGATCRPTRPSCRPRSSPRTAPAGRSPRTRSATWPSTWCSTRTSGRWRQYPRRDPRHRIEHFAVVQPRQVARAAGLGVIAVPQGRFATELGDGMLAAVGPARHGWLYRQRSLLEAGMVLPGSSDRPVVAGAPLLGIADMVNRRTASGAPFNPGEAITAAAGAARLHPRVGLRQPPGARQGLDRPGHARRPGGAVRGPHRRQPGAHRRPGRARHHRRRPVPATTPARSTGSARARAGRWTRRTPSARDSNLAQHAGRGWTLPAVGRPAMSRPSCSAATARG